MQLTPNYNLKKPEGIDPVDIQDFNDNADILDAVLNKKADSSGGDISNMTIKALDEPAGTQFPVPEAGETSKTFLGKIRKFMNDFKSWNTGVCMIGQIVNNCVTNNDKLPLSAAQGKVLMDLYSVLNTNLLVSHGSLSVLQSYITNSNYTLVKYGKVVYFSWAFFYSNTNTITGEVIATLPAAFCPIGQVRLTNFIEYVDTVNTIFITSSGLLQAYINAGSSGWNARISLSWITN